MGILEASQGDRRGLRNEASGSSGSLVGQTQSSVVLKLLRGEDLETISRRSGGDYRRRVCSFETKKNVCADFASPRR